MLTNETKLLAGVIYWTLALMLERLCLCLVAVKEVAPALLALGFVVVFVVVSAAAAERSSVVIAPVD